MNWLQTAPYTIPLFAAAFLTGLLAVLAGRRRPASGATTFTLFMIAAGIWCFAYALEIAAVDLPDKLFWAKVQYLGISTVGAFCLIFTLQYTRRWPYPTAYFSLLFIIPIITIIITWLEPRTGLLWREIMLDETGPFPALTFEYGPIFWLIVSYSYLELLTSTIFLIVFSRRVPGIYKRQIQLLVLATLFPWIGNGLYVTQLSPIANLDLTPFGFVLTGMVMGFSLWQVQLLDITPIARNNVLENIADGVLVLNRRGQIVDLNRSAAQLLGLSAETALGHLFAETAVGALMPLTNTYPQTGYQGEINLSASANGRSLFVDLQISPLHDHRNELIGQTLVLHDVTERKLAEIALANQKQLFENVVNITHAILAHYDLDNALAESIKIAQVITGAETGSLFLFGEKGQVVKSVLARGVVSAEEKQEIEANVMKSGVAGWIAEHRQALFISDTAQDGRWLTFANQPYQARSVLAVPILVGDMLLGLLTLTHSEQGNFDSSAEQLMQAVANQMALALRNAQMYDAQNQLVIELSVAKEAAEAANRSKTIFLANMTHELRTPLSAIIGYSEMLQEQAVVQADRQLAGRLQNIETSAHHLLSILNNILDYAKIEASKVSLQLEKFDLAAFIEDLRVMAMPHIMLNRNRLRIECAPDLGMICADRMKTQQILINLLSNAGKFTKDGDIMLRVFRETAVNGHKQNNAFLFQVQDTGVGIAPDQIPKLFQPFTQIDTSPTREYSGTGLGLIISHRFCELMGGSLEVKSELGVGSTFTLRLPEQTP